MDGANPTENGDGDASAREANSAEQHPEKEGDVQEVQQGDVQKDKHLDELDVEHLHMENAKRYKVADCFNSVLHQISLIPIRSTTLSVQTDVSGSTSSHGDASTSSCDNSTTDKDTEPVVNVTQTRRSTKKRTFIVINSNDSSNALDSDDDPDAPVDAEQSPNPDDAESVEQSQRSILQSNHADDIHGSLLLRDLTDDDDDDNDDDNTDDEVGHDMNLMLTDFDSDSNSDDDQDEKPVEFTNPRPKHNWFIVPEIQNRQFGTAANRQASVLFQQRCSGSLHCVERLELMYKLEKHTGCVNSINFHPNGTLLASGSDDLEIVVWDWKLGNALLSFESKHKNNVFQSKFLPLNGDDLHIVSCARDGQVRLAQVSPEGRKSSRKLGTHHGPSHKLAVMNDQPQVVLSVGEDGVVLRHDLRSTKADKISMPRNSSAILPLYSISSNPINSNEYCVSGKDYRVRSYDVRKGSEPLGTYHPFSKGEKYKKLHVTCAVYNHNGSEILASYSEDNVYLFDVGGREGTYAHCYQGHRNSATIKGVNFFGPKSEFIVSGSDCGHVFFWEKDSESIVQFLRADDYGIVNCLEPHPQLPFICTSGLDPDIKVWVPSYEENPQLTDLAQTVQSNRMKGGLFPRGIASRAAHEVETSNVLWTMWRQFISMEPSERVRRQVNPTGERAADRLRFLPYLSSSDSSSLSSSSSGSTSSASEEDSDEGPDSCAPS